MPRVESRESGLTGSVFFPALFYGCTIWRRGIRLEQEIYDALEENPIIAAIRDDTKALRPACTRTSANGVRPVRRRVQHPLQSSKRIKEAGKIAVVHVDLILGLAAKEIAVDYIRENTAADGIISTRASLVQRAKKLHMFAVLRVFLIDSMALAEIIVAQKNLHPDALDILPGSDAVHDPKSSGGDRAAGPDRRPDYREAGDPAGAGSRGAGHFHDGSDSLEDVVCCAGEQNWEGV
jgi:glycerol uptake operon antiterminator